MRQTRTQLEPLMRASHGRRRSAEGLAQIQAWHAHARDPLGNTLEERSGLALGNGRPDQRFDLKAGRDRETPSRAANRLRRRW